MSNQDLIHDLQEQLKKAKAAGKPVLVETIADNDQMMVSEIRQAGGTTTRTDYKGGPKRVEVESKPVAVSIPWFNQPVPSEVGKVVGNDEKARTIELVSGTVRLDKK